MKKLCLILAALALSTGAFAQKMWVGGTASVVALSGATSINVAPEFGLFVADDISVEAGLGAGFGKSINNFAANVVGRYWLPMADGLTYTPGVGLGFGRASVSGYGTNWFDLNLYLGAFNYQFNENWAVGANFCSLQLGDMFGDFTPAFELSTNTTFTIKYCF